MPESESSSVVPAQLSFLAIYNPSLGTTDETIRKQIVFYTSRSSLLRRHDSSTAGESKELGDDWNERLRQVGLAQGMVTFARNFSEDKAVDYVETEKSQIVLHELENGWWILASVDLTRLPDSNNGSSSQQDASERFFHYSSKEMAPPQLLIQQLRRAHSTFLLHHASNLDTLYKDVGRSTFCLFLEKFWLRFARNWDVLLGGNPAVDMYNGIKLSAGGELGFGVGEEEWGSGEREVLEDFVSRTDGLVDLVVSRFGDPYESTESCQTGSRAEDEAEHQWLGTDDTPRPSDGVIFSGVGTITRRSLVSISHWMEWIYRYGADAYGVSEDPTSPRRRRRRKRQRAVSSGKTTSNPPPSQPPSDVVRGAVLDCPFCPGIPPPLVGGSPPPRPSSKDPQASTRSQGSDESSQNSEDKASDWMTTGTETFVKYLTLGYGSSWALPGLSSGTASPLQVDESRKGHGVLANSTIARKSSKGSSGCNGHRRVNNHGKFIIGLQDDVASSDAAIEEIDRPNPTATPTQKVTKRAIHVHMADSQQETDSVQLQAVVYIYQPFIYTFLFNTTTPSLSDPSLYHSIHHQLGPLQKPLSISTSPSTAESRITVFPEFNAKPQQQANPIYDLVYDPYNLSIRSSIPNIPYLTFQSQNITGTTALSRVETISIHHRLLTTYVETRSRPLELERTCKTSRGWWIVWVRVSASPDTQQSSPGYDSDKGKQQEAFIVRRASDHSTSSGHTRNASSIGGGSGARFFRDLGGASSPGLSQSSRLDIVPSKLVEGLGLDARRYIENLLSLNR
ncbi:uncharacterized protein DSM5745_10800 [Aspergillus mulundensis]|uniref:CCZ1/INTU/HSP4 first Longin domain-containing protein n=1 Tax=Aspergillus mulundensis TaxID=1810919 RepID=A0A3D8QER1_9EURO|nr:Uncharacterized protein DSM5745_10800 [Aspergillus mulundensis]RDW60342.1 Uncharacterized protein DSM5745_10800 [Aspergillus mulundensis]